VTKKNSRDYKGEEPETTPQILRALFRWPRLVAGLATSFLFDLS
jgi:hypothetical protein